jgi:aspartate racemase
VLTLGLLGGMSWESTAEYYRLANQTVAARLGGLHSADLLLRSLDFAAVEELQTSGRWDDAGQLLAGEARRLQDAGAGVLLLCTNTMHRVSDAIEDAIDVPFVHLAEATADAVLATPVRRVGLLGTAFTMEQPFYRERLEARGLEVLVPQEGEREVVHRTIYDELCRGRFTEDSREAFRAVIGRLGDRGAAGVVLGCTEIELLLPAAEEGGLPLFATTRIHVEAGVDLALRPHHEGPR